MLTNFNFKHLTCVLDDYHLIEKVALERAREYIDWHGISHGKLNLTKMTNDGIWIRTGPKDKTPYGNLYFSLLCLYDYDTWKKEILK